MTSTRPTSRRTLALTATLALAGVTLAAPATAASTTAPAAPAATAATGAGSLVFVRDHDVWVARADGSDARPVTRDGSASAPYSTPTMSATGVVVAVQRQSLVRMTQHGAVLNRIDPPPLTNSAGQPVDGQPIDAAVSPDGRTIAWTVTSYSCPVGASCARRDVTAYTDAERYAARGRPSHLGAPSWLTDTRVALGGGFGSQVNLQTVTGEAEHWFDDSAYSHEWSDWEDLGEPDVSPDGRRLALVRSYGDTERIAFFSVDGDPRTRTPGAPSRHCETNPQEGYADPTWSADSRRVAWETPVGVMVADDPVPGCAVTPRLALPGASEPDYSAADLTPAPVALANTARPVVTGRPRVGSTLTARPGSWSGGPTSYAYQWLRAGRPIAGATTARHRVGRRDAGSALSVRVTARRGEVSAVATSRAVRAGR